MAQKSYGTPLSVTDRVVKQLAPPTGLLSSSDWADWLSQAERRTREVYLLSPDRLIAEYRQECKITSGYHGREILELLQNAGDAARFQNVPGKIRIVLTSNGLVLGNTGRPFDEGGVQSLQTANLSPKRQREAVVVGDKGLGFRSILNWTHTPLILSGELGLAFLPSYAEKILEDLAAESEQLAQWVLNEQEIAGGLIVPRLAFPERIPDWATHEWPDDEGLRAVATLCLELRHEGFDTVVGMPFSNQQAYEEIVGQLEELNPEFLLLVDSISELEFEIEGKQSKVWSCRRESQSFSIYEDTQVLSAWAVTNYEDEIPRELLDSEVESKSRFRLTLAVPDDKQTSPGTLFCYFPTEVQVPLPLLAHATVELDETRKHLNDTRANRYILGVLAERIAELAEHQVGSGASDNWAGCRLITSSGDWGQELKQFGLPESLKAAATKKMLVPVLGGGHCRATEAKLAPGTAATGWPARLFLEAASCVSLEEREFAEHLGVEELEAAEVVRRLLEADDLTLEERCGAIAGLLESKPLSENEELATLLCDEMGVPVPAGASVILQSGGKLPLIPAWATIRFLHPQLRQILGSLLETKDGRELQQKLRPFGVVEYSFSALIRPVMAEANRKVRDNPSEESLVREEALDFLWRIYRTMETEQIFPSDASVRLLNQEGKWVNPQQLYLGVGYGQEGNVTQDLFSSWAIGTLVAPPAMLGFDDAELNNVGDFLMWLGVERWPRELESQKIEQDYLEAVKARLHYPVNFDDYRFDTANELSGAWVASAKAVDGLSEILLHARSEAVLAWLSFDPRAVLWSRDEKGHGRLSVNPPRTRSARSYRGPLLSYIHWKISTASWMLTASGTKGAPSNFLIGDRQLDSLFPSPRQPDSQLLARYGVSMKINDGFRNAGVMPGLAQLGRDELYRLLLDVPELSPDGKASRALCRWFLSNDNFVFGSPGPYQERFFQKGRVWGEKQGIADYYSTSELRHVDQEGFPPTLLGKLAVALLPKRVGAQKVKDILGIKPLEPKEIRQELLSNQESPEQGNRAAWFVDAKPYIKRLRQTQTKQAQAVGAFERLELVVCDKLRVQMLYEDAVYDHDAQEGEWFIFSDRLYVLGDLDDSLALLADSVGVAVASLFGMADGDAFAKILSCDARSRAKLLKRMCGDDFYEEIEAAKAKALPSYAGSIHQPTVQQEILSEGSLEKRQAAEEGSADTSSSNREETTLGVVPLSHEPKPPSTPRNLVIRSVQSAPANHSGTRKMVDWQRCERITIEFEEKSLPSRFAMGVGHIMGQEGPGFDLVSFGSERELQLFKNPETRDWSQVERFIEVKGRSSSSAKIELKGNELRAAREYGSRYHLYRFFEADEGQFYVSILKDPMAAEEAKATIIEIDLDRANTTQRFQFILGVEEESEGVPSQDEQPGEAAENGVD